MSTRKDFELTGEQVWFAGRPIVDVAEGGQYPPSMHRRLTRNRNAILELWVPLKTFLDPILAECGNDDEAIRAAAESEFTKVHTVSIEPIPWSEFEEVEALMLRLNRDPPVFAIHSVDVLKELGIITTLPEPEDENGRE